VRIKALRQLSRILMLICLCLVRVGAQQTPADANQVIANYRAAIGSPQKFAAITSLIERGELSGDLAGPLPPFHAPTGRSDRGSFEYYFKAPNLRVTVTRFANDAIVAARGCDGNVAWYANGFQGRGVIKPKPGVLYDCDPGYDPVPQILRDPAALMKFKGIKKVGGRQALVVHVESRKLHRAEVEYFDPATYLLIRSEVAGWSGLSSSYSDYRDVGGIKFPFVVVQENDNAKITTTLREVQINVPIADSVFSQPSVQAEQRSQAIKDPKTDSRIPLTDARHVDQSLARRMELLPLPDVDPPGEIARSGKSAGLSASPSSQPVVYVNATNFSSCPIPQLLQAVPELRDLEVIAPADLNGLLDKVGAKITEAYRKTPDLVAHEEVLETQPNRPSTRRHFSYLILTHSTKDVVTLEEFRVDLRGGAPIVPPVEQKNSQTAWNDLRTNSMRASARDAGGLPLAQGFANMWVNFYPDDRAMSVFRYLGRQKIDHHNTLVIAFSQKPGSVLLPGKLRYKDKLVSLFFQGIAWVDESDFRIVRLRTDLLSPPVDVPLYQLTAEIHFADTSVVGLTHLLWLPRQVEITSDLNGLLLHDKHTYSEYRLFGVKSRIRLDP
jgi:hypothetical protein